MQIEVEFPDTISSQIQHILKRCLPQDPSPDTTKINAPFTTVLAENIKVEDATKLWEVT